MQRRKSPVEFQHHRPFLWRGWIQAELLFGLTSEVASHVYEDKWLSVLFPVPIRLILLFFLELKMVAVNLE